MSGNTEDTARSLEPSRPGLLTQHSNSLPSTPRQRARNTLSGSRTPSPDSARLTYTGRSVSSDSSKMKNPYRQGPVIAECRFKTTQTSRRRIPYTIGDGLLDRPHEDLKTRPSPEEAKRLGANIQELYQSLLPSEPGQVRRKRILEKLQQILSRGLPGRDFGVHVFGSSGNLLYTDKSDVDICVTMKDLESTCVLAEILAKNGMKNVKCVHAKAVPIVKLWDPELNLNCDLNLNNHVALKNTRLVKTYIQLDDRVRPLAMIIKHWTKKRIISEASGGTLSSYTWTLLLINFLQTRQPPILPRIDLAAADGRQRSDFREDLERHFAFGATNEETLSDLLFHFFRRYGYELNFDDLVVSVREARLLSKTEKGWDRANNNRLCVEEPFNTERNLANTADDFAFRGLHLELRRAFQLVAEAKDLETNLCEQYEFPPDPKPAIERQPALPKPTLTRSLSQSGRGGRMGQSNRGGRLHPGREPHRSIGSGNRRASSAAAFGHTPFPLYYSPQTLGLSQEYTSMFRNPQHQQGHGQADLGMHEHLTQLSRQLSAQEQQLRQRLVNQSTGASPMSSTYANSLHQHQRPPPLSVYQQGDRNTIEEAPLTAPLPQLGYPYLQWNGSQMMTGWPSPAPSRPSPATSRRGTDTNPSSPLLTPVNARRSLQRGQPDSISAGIRSQSQPARSVGVQGFPVGNPNQGYAAMMSQETPEARQQQRNAVPYPQGRVVGHVQTPDGRVALVVDPSSDPSGPKEYLGYGFGKPMYLYSPFPAQQAAQVPFYNDWRNQSLAWQSHSAQRSASTLIPSTADVSRSPSPVRRSDTWSEGLRSAPLPQEQWISPTTNLHNLSRTTPAGPPMIVNGSTRGSRSLRAESLSEPRPRRFSDGAGDLVPIVDGWAQESNMPSVQGTYQTSRIEQQQLGDDDQFQTRPEITRHFLDDIGVETAVFDSPSTTTGGSSPANESVRHQIDGASPSALLRQNGGPVAVSSNTNRGPPPMDLYSSTFTTDAPSQGQNRKSGANIAPLDISHSATLPELLKENGLLSHSKVLSPVREAATPSPPLIRKASTRGNNVEHSGSNGSLVSPALRNLPTPPTPLRSSKETENTGEEQTSNGVSDPTPSTNANPWQQAGSKKPNKKGKGPATQQEGGKAKSRGEPMPADISQRKGG